MCIIAVCEKRFLTNKEIENCFSNNNDGAGMAWYEDNKLHFAKGFMTLDEFMDFYRSKKHFIPHVVHFRIGTSGTIVPELTHPFECSIIDIRLKGMTDHPLLFHNGVYHDYHSLLLNVVFPALIKYNMKLPDGDWNDTRVIAMTVSILGENLLRTMTGRFVLVKPEGKFRLFGSFEEENGVHFSNSSYTSRYQITRYYRGNYYSKGRRVWKVD